jgi:transposase-like protein
MSFRPSRCPRPDCPSSGRGRFLYQFRGTYRRSCDGRTVQRFLCRECGRSFSIQTFRLDYRLKKPGLHLSLFQLFISKVTHRQSARILGCSRKTVAHRLELLGRHCRDLQAKQFSRAVERGGISGTFQLDEQETYEHSGKLSPVTIPVLIERHSYFVLYTEAVALPCRGALSPKDNERKLQREKIFGRRKSGSSAAVTRSFQVLSKVHAPGGTIHVQTDRKKSYCKALERTIGVRLLHERFSSKLPRNYSNPLFAINHTLAMMRDGISRLVRRTWAASKLRGRLARHIWIWIAWRNYVRGVTNAAPRVTPAMILGLEQKSLSRAELFAWRVF